MEIRHPDIDLFVHAISSPLTALHGATGLLRRRCAPVPSSIDVLIDTLERNITRLRAFGDVLVQHTIVDDDMLTIKLPVGSLRNLAVGTCGLEELRQPSVSDDYVRTVGALADHNDPIVSAPLTNDGIVLLISDYAQNLDRMHQICGAAGLRTSTTYDLTEGVDVARHDHPDLIVIDLVHYGDLAARVLGEDPDTKMLPVLLLRDKDAREGGPAPIAALRRVVERHMPDEHIVGLIHELLAAGRSRYEPHRHILIVDDEPDIQRLVVYQLEDEGYRTTAVSSGAEALRVTQRQSFDLIILDLMLPDLDGLTVLGGLRVQPQTALTPIILLSALNASHEKVRGLQLGADDYVTKPFSSEELSARVQAAMRRSELEGSANPSTRLPGNVFIERAIARRINQQAPFAVCYSDLDNFKAYNDTYGFLKGDAIIQQAAHILTAAVKIYGNADDFVGHIGGDDFVIITTPDCAEAICQEAIASFDRAVPLFYDPEARTRGYVESVDRQGNPARFPLLSISISVVTSRYHKFSHPGEIAQRSIEPKKTAKRQPGSVYVIDE